MLRIVYLDPEPLTVDELPDTVEVHFYGGLPFGSVSGPGPVEEFKTDRLIIGEVDDIKGRDVRPRLTSNPTLRRSRMG